jgi:hypothetical protein
VTSSPTTTARAAGETVVFDGGGSGALYDAFETLADSPVGTLRFGGGTYRFGNEHAPEEEHNVHAHVHAVGLEDVTIEGNGSTLLWTDNTLGAIHGFDSSGLTIRDLTFDYDPLPFSQGTVTEWSADEEEIVVELDEGYPELGGRLYTRQGHQPLTSEFTIHTEDGHFYSANEPGSGHKAYEIVERLDDRRFRLGLQSHPSGVATGRRLALYARRPGSWTLSFNRCPDLTLENLTIHASPMFAAKVKFSADAVARNVTITPGEEDRILATNGDGLHFVSGPTGPTVENCRMAFMMDDHVVVNSRMNRVAERVDDRTLRVERTLETYVREGDVLQPIAANGTPMDPLSPVSAVTLEVEEFRSRRPEEITFESALPDAVGPGTFLRNRSLSNEGFAVRNNDCRHSRARGIRITAIDGVVADNHVENFQNAGILLRGNVTDRSFPKPCPEDVTVEDNVVRGTNMYALGNRGSGALDCYLWKPDSVQNPGRPGKNLVIRNNEIEDVGVKGINVADATGVEVQGNAVTGPNQYAIPGQQYGLGFVNAGSVSVTENTVTASSDLVEGFTVARNASIEAANNRFVLDGESTPATIERR